MSTSLTRWPFQLDPTQIICRFCILWLSADKYQRQYCCTIVIKSLPALCRVPLAWKCLGHLWILGHLLHRLLWIHGWHNLPRVKVNLCLCLYLRFVFHWYFCIWVSMGALYFRTIRIAIMDGCFFAMDIIGNYINGPIYKRWTISFQQEKSDKYTGCFFHWASPWKVKVWKTEVRLG